MVLSKRETEEEEEGGISSDELWPSPPFQVREQLSNSATQPEHNGPSEATPSQVRVHGSGGRLLPVGVGGGVLDSGHVGLA